VNPFDAFGTARAEFERRLHAIGVADWDKPSPCEGWTVRDVVHHVVAGNRAQAMVLRGGNAVEIVAARATPIVDPVAEFGPTADEVLAAASVPGTMEGIVHHPAGDMPGSQAFSLRPMELLLHAWDVARGIGVDETLDPECVAFVWAVLQPSRDTIGTRGVFGTGPSDTLGDDAPLQQRLLDLSGRRP
jgi:uncharacterized protein (TIGR03086 family)